MAPLALRQDSMLGSVIPLRTDSAMVDSLSGGRMTVAESSLLTQPYTIVTGTPSGNGSRIVRVMDASMRRSPCALALCEVNASSRVPFSITTIIGRFTFIWRLNA